MMSNKVVKFLEDEDEEDYNDFASSSLDYVYEDYEVVEDDEVK